MSKLEPVYRLGRAASSGIGQLYAFGLKLLARNRLFSSCQPMEESTKILFARFFSATG